MPKTKDFDKNLDPFGEEASLLYPDERDQYARFRDTPETPIIKGVVNQLRKWPMDVLFAFLAGCLIVAGLVLLTIDTVAVCMPAVLGNSVEEISVLETRPSPNVYFFKLDNQNWSTKDFCYIETAARRHPDFNVYLINLMREEPNKASPDRSAINRTSLESKLTDSNDHHSPTLTPEERLRQRLVHGNGNIRNVSVSVDQFFKGTELSKVAKELDDEVLEIAAKAQLLWSVPGITLRPHMFCSLDFIKNYLCNNTDECLPDGIATIEPENDIQLTGVPCQAFMGFVVQEISRHKHNGKYTLREAMEKYCPRLYYCPEIRILTSKPCRSDSLDCPTVYSSIVMHVT